MAGSYPDVPGYRFAYDKDGSSIIYYSASDTTNAILSNSATSAMNSDRLTSTVFDMINYSIVAFLFPERRNVIGAGLFIGGGGSLPGSINLQWSDSTTNGYDGTWSNITALNNIAIINSVNKPDLRTRIVPINAPNVTALRFYNGGSKLWGYMYGFHLYGSIATTESPDRLRIVDISGDDIAAQLDFGDIRQRNNVTKQFKVVNNSSTKTANNITVTFDVPTDASPTLVGQYQLSTDNTAFANAINIGTLAPGQSSGTLYLRDTVAANAQLSVWSLRIIASANTWS